MGPRKDDDERDEVPVTIRFPRGLQAEAKEFADADDRSFNLYVVRALRAQVESDRKRKERNSHARP